jgi:trigger factor
MKTEVSEIGKNKVRLSVEVPPEDVRRLADRTYKRLARDVRIPGFRPGKAPRQVIDQRLGREYVRGEVLREVLPGLYAEALSTTELDVVAAPEIDVKTFEDGEGLAFEAVVETRPTPELKDYLGLPVQRPPTEVTEAEVDEQMEQLRVRFATLEVVRRPIRTDDFALIDLTTYRHEQIVEEATAKDLLLEVGAGMIVPELDAELEGKRKGDILKITATLPERFGERTGWQVGMQILVKEVKARNLPALDDDLAKTVSEFDTYDELRSDVRDRLGNVKEAQAESAVRDRVVERFVEDAVEVDLPDGMVALEVDGLIETLARVLAAQGASLEAYMASEDIDPDALRQRFREQAERNLTLRLGLDAVGAAEGLEATEDDRAMEVERIAGRVQRPPAQVREALDEGRDWASVDGDIIRAKALDLLVEKAEISVTEESS